MIIISRDLVLTETAEINPNNPVIGYRNVVTSLNITADGEAAGFPAVNLANPATHLRWKGANTDEQYITIVTNEVDPIDYVGIAGHNFSSAGIPVSIDALIDEVWTEIVQDVIPPDDSPLIHRFDPQSISDLRIRMQEGDAAPEAAVVYAGRLLVLQRRIYVGHTPIKYGRSANIVNGRSESGNFLGRIVLGEETGSSVEIENIEPDWYRLNLDPFILASKETPFFFAWRPDDYPNEVGYAWITNDPQPSNQRPNGMMQISLRMGGTA